MTDTTSYDYAQSRPHQSWLRQAENWLDARGKGAWIAAMVLGFVFFWPVGLALLAYMIWSKRMFNKGCNKSRHNRTARGFGPQRSTGNSAFDAYREETLRRLQQEQDDFEAFLERLRAAKDKSEFDQFMDERARAPRETAPQTETHAEA